MSDYISSHTPDGIEFNEQELVIMGQAGTLWLFQRSVHAIILQKVTERENNTLKIDFEKYNSIIQNLQYSLPSPKTRNTAYHFIAKRIIIEHNLKKVIPFSAIDRLNIEFDQSTINDFTLARQGEPIHTRIYKVATIGKKNIQNVVIKDCGKDNSESACFERLHSCAELSDEEKLKITPNPIKTKNLDFICLLFHHYSGGDLFNYVNSYKGKFFTEYSLYRKLAVAKQLIEQMAILAKAGLVYTDIKSHNVLVEAGTYSDTVHFCDFQGCFFVDTPQDFSGCYIVTAIMQSDHEKLLKAHRKPDDEKKAALTLAANTHMARGLSLLLIELFTNASFTYKDTSKIQGYSEHDLNAYIENNPMRELKWKSSKLHDLILTAARGALTPQKFWELASKLT